MDMTLSVAIITYNQEQYISQTLDSILIQQHNYPYEIVVGDDCSSDGTRKIIDAYVEKYPNIIKTLYNEKNLGLIGNYFNVIAHCAGKYIMECAGDDWWVSGKVENQIQFMETHEDIGMCYGKVKIWNEKKNSFEKKSLGAKCESFEELIQGNAVPAVSVCIRNSIYRKYIESINPANQNWAMEDYPAWLWFSKESKIKFLDSDFAVYRILQESASHSTDVDKYVAFHRSVNDIQNFYRTMYSMDNISFDLHKAREEFYSEKGDRKLAYRELKLVENKSFKLYIKYLLYSNPVLFSLLKLYRKIKYE